MRNYLTLGPVRLRVSNRHLAPWGYERLGIAGLSFLSRTNGGDLVLASYHPKRSITWIWSVIVMKAGKNRPWVDRSKKRGGQWHDYYWLPFNRELCISHQNYHARPTKQ